jgi:hypothetical protein
MSKYVCEGNELGYPTPEAFRLIREIKWKSADKDNMEFETKITYCQKEALDALIAYAVGMY